MSFEKHPNVYSLTITINKSISFKNFRRQTTKVVVVFPQIVILLLVLVGGGGGDQGGENQQSKLSTEAGITSCTFNGRYTNSGGVGG